METNNQNSARQGRKLFPFKDESRILDIRYDPVFKAVFTKDTEKSRGALSDLISSLIGRVVEVETIIANEPSIDDLRERYLRFDVACKSKKGEPINVEMSFNPKPYEQVRLEYHASRLFVGQDIHGKEKNYNDLKESYQIAILAKEKFFPDENFAHNFLFYDPDNHVSLGGRIRIITVELVKTEPVADKPVNEMTNSELWAVFFQYLTDPEKRDIIIEIINKKEGIAMAAETLSNVTQDEIEYARMTTLIKSELDYRSEMKYERDSGREEGIEQEKLIIAKNLLAKGSTFEFVSEITGLSIDEIKRLQ